MNVKTKKLVMAALMAALACIATMVIKVPIPGSGGYLNLGDCVVLMTGWLLSPWYAFAAAGLGSALADVFSGDYVIYAPATFVIKAIMALIMCYGFKLLERRIGSLATAIISGLVAEIIMVAGYFVFESFLGGVAMAVGTVVPNTIQGAVGLVIGVILIKIFEKSKINLQ